MSKLFTKRFYLSLVLVALMAFSVQAQTSISGSVVDGNTKEPLLGVSILVKGKVVGTISDTGGNYKLNVSTAPPLTLVFSMVGYTSSEIEINEANVEGLEVILEESAIMGQEVVVAASRVEESILQSPVSIEKMDILAVKNSASDSYYKSIANLKGVDVTSSSVNFQVINARGFSSTGNTRFVQMTDGMDTQAPALNFPVGNLNGPSELDVEGLELIPGAASALYGPSAFNGVLLVTSKNPFEYQGLSAMYKIGVNHIGGDEEIGEPGSPQPMHMAAIRYAKAFNDKFAFKVNVAYSRAEDWHGTNYDDKNIAFQGNYARNPAYDGVHTYGDDGTTNLALLSLSPSVSAAISAGISGATGAPTAITDAYAQNLPNLTVGRKGFEEQYLVDYGAENLKINTALHYRLNDRMELSYTLNYGYGTTVYTGAQRYSLSNFSIMQHKLELKGDNFFVKGYTTQENSGDSYIADLVGYSVNSVATGNYSNWFGIYGTGVGAGILGQVAAAQGGNPTYNQAIVDAIVGNQAAMDAITDAAFAAAQATALEPGTPAFDAAKAAALGANISDGGARFNDKSNFYHAEGQFDFKNQIDFMDLQAGASFRQYNLKSNGTIFADADGGIAIKEYGAYLQASKRLISDNLKLSGSLRFDKNENFDGQLNPRLSAVYTVAQTHNFRASYQTGFRNPTTQGQHIDLNVITAQLIGGLAQYGEKYKITENAYTIESVNSMTQGVIEGDPTAPTRLVPFTEHKEVKPEQIRSIEFGYRSNINNKLFFDAAVYFNQFDDFISQIRVRKASGPFTGTATDQAVVASLLSGDNTNTFQVYTNNTQTVKAKGATLGIDYLFDGGYKFGANYNWNKLDDASLDAGFLNDFNTPEHKYNVSFGNREIIKDLGFNVTYRWQDAFHWESSFAQGPVDAVGTVDAQVSYKLKNLKSILKLGGSNLTNERYVLNYGGPRMGAIYYLSITFDQFMN
ncbi:TonB-dependent receptor [Reichenbachiella carrageenanivorans]|uniref:TonB-dependent receptor n=1 Tax=Reichenbachiella carrageenanivorans TaxID=2979869 RepID=A0ABY6D1P4_9BACT|nr:TonB-dependent receptor [Reichenbachiella carrageenanivorans]UXX80087.1 TonB-dependent receptor [Reichenbachiella carrageenanivorans]